MAARSPRTFPRHGARGAAVLAILLLAACGRDLSGWDAEAQARPAPFVLTADGLERSLDLVVTTRPAENPVNQLVGGELTVRLSVQWTPPAFDAEPPLVEATLTRPDTEEDDYAQAFVAAGGPLDLVLTAPVLKRCTDAEACTERFSVWVGRSGEPNPGEVRVEPEAVVALSGVTPEVPGGFVVAVAVE